MARTILFIISFLPLLAAAQSDFLILKKNGRQVCTYFIGDELIMESVYNQTYDGTITNLRHDSIFLNGVPFHYREIATVHRYRTGSLYMLGSSAMMVAAAGILVLGPVNGLYRKDKPKDWYSTSGLISAAALAAGSFGLKKAYARKYRLGKKYSLQYLDIHVNKKL